MNDIMVGLKDKSKGFYGLKFLLAWCFCWEGSGSAAVIAGGRALALIRSDCSGAAIAGPPAQLTWVGLHEAWLGAGQSNGFIATSGWNIA